MRRFKDEPVGVEAADLVGGERQKTYGDPLDNYPRIAAMWSAILGRKMRAPISRREAMHMMIALKQARDLNHPFRDNEVDICGYAHLLQMDREDAELDAVGGVDFDEDSEPEDKPEPKNHKVHPHEKWS